MTDRDLARRWIGALAATALFTLPASGAWAGTADPGRLPQTRAEPALGVTLNAQMLTLWRAITSDDVALARSVFFPETAYVKMKTGLLASPAGDFVDRLVGFYNLDLGAYHRLIAGGHARLVRVSDARADAAWIAPGACENLVGYWHLPGVRLVYTRAGATYSVAVFSLISWHGVWYVVHLGPNPRPSDVGTVDGFTHGPGTPGPAGGC
ncbi:MAG: hypothetical protein ACRDV0_08545 [Acidimicrobiales bacterium]